MPTIYGPQTGHATLYDTSDDDTIIAAGGYNTIYSLYGNDTISTGSIGYNTILAGTQCDYSQRDVTIRLNGLGNTVDGGDANFTIFNSSGDSTINLGDGNDNLTLGGLDNTITIGLGADNIVAGGGDDSVTVVGFVDSLDGPAPERYRFSSRVSETASTTASTPRSTAARKAIRCRCSRPSPAAAGREISACGAAVRS